MGQILKRITNVSGLLKGELADKSVAHRDDPADAASMDRSGDYAGEELNGLPEERDSPHAIDEGTRSEEKASRDSRERVRVE